MADLPTLGTSIRRLEKAWDVLLGYKPLGVDPNPPELPFPLSFLDIYCGP